MRANKILDFDSTQDDFVRAVIYPIAMVDYEGFLRSISSSPSERKKKSPEKIRGFLFLQTSGGRLVGISGLPSLFSVIPIYARTRTFFVVVSLNR